MRVGVWIFGVAVAVTIAACGSAHGISDNGITCSTQGKCPNEPPPTQSDIDACNSALASACATPFKAFLDCIYTKEVCAPGGGADVMATQAACQTEYDAALACANMGTDGGMDGSTSMACSKLVPTGTCPSGQTCLGGSCCATGNVCGYACCNAGQTCFDDGTGTNKRCVTACTASSQCPQAMPCCGPLDKTGKCDNSGTTWACIPNNVTCNGPQVCRCSVGADCQSGSCAPHVDQGTMQPIGPYVCKANNGGPYNGCNGLQTCAGNTCCVTDGSGNKFCANPCTNNSMCAPAQCNTYSFASSSCTGPKACGP